jgi:zinc-ribbon domain
VKLFSCQVCGQLLYFENVRCEECGRYFCYLTDPNEISALDPIEGGGWTVLAAPGQAYKFCQNYEPGMCNWMLPADNDGDFCAACRYNRLVPDLSVPCNDVLWRKIETDPIRHEQPQPQHGSGRSLSLRDLCQVDREARLHPCLGAQAQGSAAHGVLSRFKQRSDCVQAPGAVPDARAMPAGAR